MDVMHILTECVYACNRLRSLPLENYDVVLSALDVDVIDLERQEGSRNVMLGAALRNNIKRSKLSCSNPKSSCNDGEPKVALLVFNGSSCLQPILPSGKIMAFRL